MSERKFTDEEIIAVVKRCASPVNECEGCPFEDVHRGDRECFNVATDELIEIASRQKKELAALKQSENIIELPCKLGTTLYFLYNSPYADKPDLTPRIYKTTDWYFEVDKKGIVINTSDIHSFNKKYDYYLGETVFFTKEEAEKVIAELKKKYTEGNDERSD